jgi:uncharacterized membrane protein SirB2
VFINIVCIQPIALPREVLELVLIKGVVALYVFHQLHTLPQAAWLSVNTIASVCFEWFSIVARRKHNQREIRHQIKRTVSLLLQTACLHHDLKLFAATCVV